MLDDSDIYEAFQLIARLLTQKVGEEWRLHLCPDGVAEVFVFGEDGTKKLLYASDTWGELEWHLLQPESFE